MKALITARLDPQQLQKLELLFSEIIYAGWGSTKVKLSEAEMSEYIRDVDVVIIEFEPLTAQVIAAAQQLKLIACCRNEPEANVDVSAATERGIPVISGAGRNAISVAEFAFGMLLSLSRNIARTSYLLQYTDEITGLPYTKSDSLTGQSEWSLDDKAPFNRYGGPELYGKNLGVVGLGTIGKVMARMGNAFGMRVLVYDPYMDEQVIVAECQGVKVSLEELMKQSDFISLHAKVTDETVGLINYENLSLMKESAYIVNTARAAIMDYDALHRICTERKIAGAALDVFPSEPIQRDNPFLSLDNVLLTPHLAGSSHDIPKHHSRLIVEDVTRYFNGERPQRIMNPQVLDSSL